jgi:hypothetical protein
MRSGKRSLSKALPISHPFLAPPMTLWPCSLCYAFCKSEPRPTTVYATTFSLTRRLRSPRFPLVLPQLAPFLSILQSGFRNPILLRHSLFHSPTNLCPTSHKRPICGSPVIQPPTLVFPFLILPLHSPHLSTSSALGRASGRPLSSDLTSRLRLSE